MSASTVSSSIHDEEAADLPIERITRSYPFERVGIGFAGPFYYRLSDERRLTRCFTCGAKCAQCTGKQKSTAKQTDREPPQICNSDLSSDGSESENDTVGVFSQKKPRRTKKNEPKAWVVLLTCATSPALHLELITDM